MHYGLNKIEDVLYYTEDLRAINKAISDFLILKILTEIFRKLLSRYMMRNVSSMLLLRTIRNCVQIMLYK